MSAYSQAKASLMMGISGMLVAPAAAVLGYLGLLVCGLTIILSVIFGHMALWRTVWKKEEKDRAGAEVAGAGLVLSYIAVVMLVVYRHTFLTLMG